MWTGINRGRTWLHDSWHLSQHFVVVLQAFLCFWTCRYLQFWNAPTFESLPNLVQVCSLLLVFVPVQNFQAEPESMLAAFSPECFGFCLIYIFDIYIYQKYIVFFSTVMQEISKYESICEQVYKTLLYKTRKIVNMFIDDSLLTSTTSQMVKTAPPRYLPIITEIQLKSIYSK